MSKKNEKYLIDQVILHSQLYKKYRYKENEIGFYDNLKQLQDLIGATCLDTALDYAVLKTEEELNAVKQVFDMVKTSQYEEIKSFLKKNGYSYTVKTVLTEYKERYGKWYVSHTMEHVIVNCIKPIKELVEMGY